MANNDDEDDEVVEELTEAKILLGPSDNGELLNDDNNDELTGAAGDAGDIIDIGADDFLALLVDDDNDIGGDNGDDGVMADAIIDGAVTDNVIGGKILPPENFIDTDGIPDESDADGDTGDVTRDNGGGGGGIARASNTTPCNVT
jgi:hypothetical protein